MAPQTRSATGSLSIPTHSFVDLAKPNQDGDKQATRRRKSRKSLDAAVGPYDEPPIFVVDLDLPPSERYVSVANAYKAELENLTVLFDDLVYDYIHPKCPAKPVAAIAKTFLRKLYSEEETEELRGISRAIGVPMYLLIAFNVLLDALAGCSSGGIRVKDEWDRNQSHMIHYRTLDWDMDPLRNIVVQLDFIRGPNSPVTAHAITYVGYVGVLTGVRPGLSLSLNFRTEHDKSTLAKSGRYMWHCLQVLLGNRPSVSSVLRTALFPSASNERATLYDLASQLTRIRTPAAYIILSDGNETVVLEKDLDSAETLTSDAFIAATNHDTRHDPTDSSGLPDPNKELNSNRKLRLRTGLECLIAESVDRKQCMQEKWEAAQKRARRGQHAGNVAVRQEDVVRWLNDWPVTNEGTHFACVMDPVSGEIEWCVRRRENAEAPEHMTDYYAESHGPLWRASMAEIALEEAAAEEE